MAGWPMLSAILAWWTISYPASSFAGSADFADLFDTPLKREIVPSRGNHPEGTCIWFADLMVREVNTDGPGGGPSTLLPVGPGANRPPCDDGRPPALRPEQTRDGLLLGRKGQFLVFASYAAAGATPFVIVDATNSRVIYSDAIAATFDAVKTVDVTENTLHLRFTREVDAPCSLLLDTASCWAVLLRIKAIPPALATPPAATLCAEPYRSVKDPTNAPSIIMYDVDMTIQSGWKAHVMSRGAMRCEGPS